MKYSICFLIFISYVAAATISFSEKNLNDEEMDRILNEIPNPEEVTALDLGHNKLSYIPKLQRFVNLKRVDFSYNQITSLTTRAFKGLPNLSQLVLHKNLISAIEDGVFVELSSLVFLHISGNQIVCIDVNAFKGLHKVRFLVLDNNELESIPVDALKELKALFSLSILKNPLVSESVSEILEFTKREKIAFTCDSYRPEADTDMKEKPKMRTNEVEIDLDDERTKKARVILKKGADKSFRGMGAHRERLIKRQIPKTDTRVERQKTGARVEGKKTDARVQRKNGSLSSLKYPIVFFLTLIAIYLGYSHFHSVASIAKRLLSL
jgi:Leucine-rich repeat (LRR) protein